MNLFKKIIVGAVSCSMIFSSLFGANSAYMLKDRNIYAEALETISYSSEKAASASDDTYTQPEEKTTIPASDATIVTTAVSNANNEETVTSTAATTIQIVVTAETKPVVTATVPSVTEPSFKVFSIYEAYQKYAASTTAVTSSISTHTTITVNALSPNDVSKGIKGIDVSKWQADIDWKKVKNDGINFAIIRAGYGKLASQKDPMFDTNMVNAQKAGVDTGVYWYSYATTVEDAYKEADLCYSVIKDYAFKYPVMFDIEEPSQAALSTAAVSAIIDAFCSRMQSYGYYVSIYSYASLLNTKVYDSILKKYDVAVAHYGVKTPDFALPYGMWQYSSKGAVDGITGNVDMDYAYRDYPYIMATTHKNGY